MPEIKSLYTAGEINDNEFNKLLVEAKNGNAEAFDKMCRSIYVKVYHYLYYRVRNKDDAEDLTSEVMIKMAKAFKNQHGNFIAWVYRIAKNTLIDYYRKGKTKEEISYENLSQEIPAEERAKEVLRIGKLKEAIEYLTKEQADVITLKFFQEYDNAEIARIMGKSVGAIKVLQYRALKSLRDYFRKKGYEIKD